MTSSSYVFFFEYLLKLDQLYNQLDELSFQAGIAGFYRKAVKSKTDPSLGSVLTGQGLQVNFALCGESSALNLLFNFLRVLGLPHSPPSVFIWAVFLYLGCIQVIKDAVPKPGFNSIKTAKLSSNNVMLIENPTKVRLRTENQRFLKEGGGG